MACLTGFMQALFITARAMVEFIPEKM